MRATLGTILLAVCALPAASAAQVREPIIVVDGVPVGLSDGASVNRRGVDAQNPVSSAFRFVARLVGGSAGTVHRQAIPEAPPVDRHYEAAMRELDQELRA